MPTRRDFLASATGLGTAAAFGETAAPAGPDGEPPLPDGAFRRLGSARFRCGHYALAVADDGRHLVAHDGVFAEVWDAATGRRLRRFRTADPGTGTWNIAFHATPAGRIVVLCRTEDGEDNLNFFAGYDLFGKLLFRSPSGPEFPNRHGMVKAFDPSGARYFTVTDCQITAFDCRTFAPLWGFDYPDQSSVALAPRRDGAEVLFRRNDFLLVLDAASGAIRRRADLGGLSESRHFRELRLSDDGTLAAFRIAPSAQEARRGDPGLTAVCGFDPGRVLWTDAAMNDLFGFVAGDREVIAERNRRWHRFDARTGRPLGALNVEYPSFLGRTPDPNVLTFNCGWTAGVGFLDLAADRVLAKSANPHLAMNDVRFDATGRVVAEVPGLGAGPLPRWLRWDAAGGPAAVVEAGRSPDGDAEYALSPDGRRYLVSGPRRVELFDAATHRRLAVGAGPDRGSLFDVASVRWSPDSKEVATTRGDRTTILSAVTGLSREAERFAGFPGGPTFRTAAGERRRVSVAPVQTFNDPWRGCAVTTHDEGGGNRNESQIESFQTAKYDVRGGRIAGFKSTPGGFQARGAGTLQVREVEAGAVVWEWRPADSDGWGGQPILSPDGRTVAFARAPHYRDQVRECPVEFHEIHTGGVRWRIAFESFNFGIAFDDRGRTVLTVHKTAPILLWDVYGERTGPLPKPTAADLDRAWADLASADAAAGFRAVRMLVQHPAAAVPMLKAQAAAEPRFTDATARARIARLDDPDYRTREAAERDLALGTEDWLDLMKDAAQATGSPEAKARLERLVGNAERPTPATIRAVRSAEVLEAAHTVAARALLADWAAGPPRRTLTREAVATLDRWE